MKIETKIDNKDKEVDGNIGDDRADDENKARDMTFVDADNEASGYDDKQDNDDDDVDSMEEDNQRDADDMDVYIAAQEHKMINSMMIVEHNEGRSPGSETDEISDEEMQRNYTKVDKNYNIGGGNNHHSHEHNNSRDNIGSSHPISNQGRIEIINNTHDGLAGSQSIYPFHSGFTANEHRTTNCTNQMIITELTFNDGNYTTVPDFNTEHICNNGNKLIPRGTAELIIRNEYTAMYNEITEQIFNEYTEAVDVITESTLHGGYTAFINGIRENILNSGDMITPNVTTASTLNDEYKSIPNGMNNFLNTINVGIHKLDSSLHYDNIL